MSGAAATAARAGSDIVRAALDYHACGWAPIPLPARVKGPTLREWQRARYTTGDILCAFAGAGGVGLLLGEASAGLVDVDLDSAAARAAWPLLGLRTDMRHGRASAPESHAWYVVDAPPKTERLRDLDGSTLIELRSTGGQTVVPPSVHPSGEPILWHAEGNPARVDVTELRRAVRRTATAAMLACRWPEGARHDAALALAGLLLRGDISQPDAKRLVEVVARVAGDSEWRDRARAVGDTAAAIARGDRATGGPRLAELLPDGEAVVARLREWLGVRNSATVADDDSLPLDLWGSHLAGRPALDLTTLPAVLVALANDVALRVGCDPALFALLALGVCAGALDDRHVVQPRQHDTEWRTPARLWVLGATPIAGGKTPALEAATRPLRIIDTGWAEEDAGPLRRYALTVRAHNKSTEQWLKSGGHGEPPVEPSRPRERQRLVEDITTERLSDMLADNPAGVLIVADEISGLIGSMDAYRPKGVTKDQPLYLALHEGGPRKVERVKRGKIAVSNWGASIVGGIQPERLRQIAPAIIDDGLLARCVVFFGGDEGVAQDCPPNRTALDRYAATIERLVALTPVAGHVYLLSPDAHARRAYVAQIAKAVRVLPTTSPGFAAHLGKWEGLFARLLLTWHLTDAASRNETPLGAIGADAAERVARLMVDYLLPHAAHLYGELLGQDHLADARGIAGHILAHRLERISVRDIGQAYHWLRGTRRAIDEAMQTLTVAAWVSPIDLPGRPPMRWRVNPQVHARFGARAAAERVRREAIRERTRKAAELLDLPEEASA